jgi:uncharacterized peroxidase-related enzyme
MSRFPSLPDQPHLGDAFKRFGRGIWPLCEFHDVVLRGESEWSVAERELMAAYVSGLNACQFCHGSHRMIAELHGIDEHVLEGLMDDASQELVGPRLAPVLAYLRKLTLTPARVTDTDAQAVFAQGVSEQALFDAITICALFNFMNRIVEGCGVVKNEANMAASRSRHMNNLDNPAPYRAFARQLGFSPEPMDPHATKLP